MGKRWVRAVRFALWGLAAVHLAEAIWLRRRSKGIASLPEPAGSSPGGGPEELTVLAVEGSELDETTRESVVREMETSGAELVDLLPGDLPVEQTFAMLHLVDPEQLADEPLCSPGGANEALVMRSSVAKRMGLDGDRTLDRAGMCRWTPGAQRYAPTAKVLRRAPNLRAAPTTAEDRWQELDVRWGFMKPQLAGGPLYVGSRLAHLVVMTGGLLAAPAAGAVALATWSAQPALVLGEKSLGINLLRLPKAWADRVGIAAAACRQSGGPAAATEDENEEENEPSEAHESSQPAALARRPAPSPESLFDPRRSACPWCGSSALTPKVTTTDLLQHKPGTFHLDECRDCGHIFQNPALSLQGLDYYYEQFYDGLGGEVTELIFGAMVDNYVSRLESVTQHIEPRSWLDVGTSHGHFCLAARQQLPHVVFDGLDMGSDVEEGQRRGWIDTAYRGLFPDMADGLPRSYDVVSMYHYLEHTRDPRLDLTAAAKVLEPGGYLTIEVPDPASPWSHRLGRYWPCWFQPQHQHFVACENLVTELERTGWDVVSVLRGPAATGMDVTMAVSAMVGKLAPPPWPWLPEPTASQRVKRPVVLAAGMPAMAAAFWLDIVKDTWGKRPDNTNPSNAYRVVARRR